MPRPILRIGPVVPQTASRIGAANLYSDQLGKACTDIADLNIKGPWCTDVLEGFDDDNSVAAARICWARRAPPEPPYDPDKVISTPIAAGNLSWKHSVAMTLAAMVTFIAQSAYRFRQTASMVINGIFSSSCSWLYRDSARREAATNGFTRYGRPGIVLPSPEGVHGESIRGLRARRLRIYLGLLGPAIIRNRRYDDDTYT